MSSERRHQSRGYGTDDAVGIGNYNSLFKASRKDGGGSSTASEKKKVSLTEAALKETVKGGVAKGSATAAAKSEKRRRNEIRKRIEVLRELLPDSVRNKNVIEVLDDTILLINNLKNMLEAAHTSRQSLSSFQSLQGMGMGVPGGLNSFGTMGTASAASQLNRAIEVGADVGRSHLDGAINRSTQNLVTMIQQRASSGLGNTTTAEQQQQALNHYLQQSSASYNQQVNLGRYQHQPTSAPTQDDTSLYLTAEALARESRESKFAASGSPKYPSGSAGGRA